MELARQEGKTHIRDAVKIFESHTNYEWLLQIALNEIGVSGNRREDLRMGWLAAAIIANDPMRTEPISSHKLKNIAAACASYMNFLDPDKED